MLDHEKLDVYRVARELNIAIESLVGRASRTRQDLSDQLRRAGASIVLNVAEGAGEFAPREKARFYRIAKRSATECSAVLDLLQDVRIIGPREAEPVRVLLERTVAMLIRLSKSAEPPRSKS